MNTTKLETELIPFIVKKSETYEDITIRQQKFLSNIVFTGLFDDNLILSVSSEEEKALISNILEPFITPCCSEFVGSKVSVFIKIVNQKQIKQENSLTDTNTVVLSNPLNFDKEMVFSTYIVGMSNKTVFAAAESVAEHPGTEINPLYIYGSPGLGKTHLLNAIANEISNQEPNKNIIYTTAEGFVDDFVTSMKLDNKKTYDEKYNSADVLLLDDIQFFSENMQGSMNAFFSLFEKMINENKQIVVTADVTPDELNSFHTRMKSRLMSNIYVGIDIPETELKINYIISTINKIITNEEDKRSWTKEIIQQIAEIKGINIRELSGFLSNIIFYCNIHDEKISEGVVNKMLSSSYFSSNKEISLDTITDATSSYFNIKKEEILGNNRTPVLVNARHISMYLCRKLTNYTTTQIGKYFNKDHSAVIAADKKIKKLINEKTQIYNEIENISKKINK